MQYFFFSLFSFYSFFWTQIIDVADATKIKILNSTRFSSITFCFLPILSVNVRVLCYRAFTSGDVYCDWFYLVFLLEISVSNCWKFSQEIRFNKFIVRHFSEVCFSPDVCNVFIYFSESFPQSWVEFVFYAVLGTMSYPGGDGWPFVTWVRVLLPCYLCS